MEVLAICSHTNCNRKAAMGSWKSAATLNATRRLQREPHYGLNGAVCVAEMTKIPMVDSLVQSVLLLMARNPMADSLVQSVWLQMARNPMEDSLVQSVWLQMARNPMAASLL